jgi:hypothetical protein
MCKVSIGWIHLKWIQSGFILQFLENVQQCLLLHHTGDFNLTGLKSESKVNYIH